MSQYLKNMSEILFRNGTDTNKLEKKMTKQDREITDVTLILCNSYFMLVSPILLGLGISLNLNNKKKLFYSSLDL